MRRVLLAVLLLLPAAASAARKTVKAELGKEFTLRKHQRAKLADTDASLLLTGFTNSPCPKGARCIWSGLAVHLELTVAGSTVALESAASPYSVETVKSDYTTFATLRASKRDP
ncbi:MAG: hypothetical protein M0D55_03695 [Elusimicrobiota bacterium]|nr:MAG: hypothetical protein M0D55_03695 [Elusimicrobiota bacterium]